jgi:hypothetical protein
MMKLFAIYIGGKAEGANIEVHDMRFVVAENIEAAYPELKRQWWGVPESLHLDAWSEISQADGYRVTLQSNPPTNPEKLFYVNLGGYDKTQFTELHKNVFVVAASKDEAKKKALLQAKGWSEGHRDDLYEAEECFALNDTSKDYGLYIHLEKIADMAPAVITCKYVAIGRRAS